MKVGEHELAAGKRARALGPRLALVPPSGDVARPHVIEIDDDAKRDLTARIAVGALRGALTFMKARLDVDLGTPPRLEQPPRADSKPDKEVMTADEVAAFLGVDRNTVYDYAGRGLIPHQRLWKRILFGRGALVSWLESSCKATSIRKG